MSSKFAFSANSSAASASCCTRSSGSPPARPNATRCTMAYERKVRSPVSIEISSARRINACAAEIDSVNGVTWYDTTLNTRPAKRNRPRSSTKTRPELTEAVAHHAIAEARLQHQAELTKAERRRPHSCRARCSVRHANHAQVVQALVGEDGRGLHGQQHIHARAPVSIFHQGQRREPLRRTIGQAAQQASRIRLARPRRSGAFANRCRIAGAVRGTPRSTRRAD